MNGMGVIRERVDNIAQTIAALNEQTATIGEITQTVTDLADQSNLLALNAAIEAARAGEQGRGFADATQRVRQFAERAKAAIDQMQDVLRDIEQAGSTAATVAAQSTEGVAKGAGLAGQAGQVIATIAREAESGAQANMQVAAVAQQQTAGMAQIGQAMGAIQQATTETLSSTRQAEKAAKNLAGLTQSLQDAVAAYRL
jgi:methyl-accepting chemotaxis protein